ncbi:MAG: hypothetical protein AAF596_05270, partial [Planctomycetota bacterium]
SDVRDQLRNLSASLIEAANSAEEELRDAAPDGAAETDGAPGASDNAEKSPPESEEQAAPSEEAANADPESVIERLDSLLATLDTLLDDREDKPPLLVAAVQADKPEDGPLDDATNAALLDRLGELISEVTDEGQSVAIDSGKQLLVVLEGDSVDDASRRLEQVRQQVEANTFVDSGGVERKLTVSCGMAQSAPDVGRDELRELIGEALGEAHRYGGNRACHHDGKFPAPVMPEDFEIEPRTVTLA